VRWWGTRVARFGILLVALAALLLAPIHLTQTSALVVGISGLTLLALLAFTGVRRLLFRVQTRAATELHVFGRAMPVTATRDVRTFGALLRALGVAVPALGFFVAWALLFAIIWAATVEIVAATGFLAAYVGAFLGGRGLTATASRSPDSA